MITHQEIIAQSCIALFGVTAVLLSQIEARSVRRWVSIFGLIGQPFWFYAAWHSEQWGILALCVLYSLSWGRGFYTSWIAPDRWTPDECIARAVTVIKDDGRWMAHDLVASTLTTRYEKLLTPGWESVATPHASQLREELGLEPQRDTAKRPVGRRWMDIAPPR